MGTHKREIVFILGKLKCEKEDGQKDMEGR